VLDPEDDAEEVDDEDEYLECDEDLSKDPVGRIHNRSHDGQRPDDSFDRSQSVI